MKHEGCEHVLSQFTSFRYYLCWLRDVRMDRMKRRRKRRLHGWRREVDDHSVIGFSVMKGGEEVRHDSIQPLPLPDPLISSPERGKKRKK